MDRLPVVARPAAGAQRPRWQRWLWLAGGFASLALGVVGLALPVMPTVPFVLLAAWCFSRGCERCERWLLEHPTLGPPIIAWRQNRAVPLRAKQVATAMMAASSVFMLWLLPWPWRWMPAAICALVVVWLWRLPTAEAMPSPSPARGRGPG
jgi:uncharacterized membrane protein YbaN (DUF454 family)